MRHVLHILTRPEDPWVRPLLEPPSAEPDTAVRIIDLTQPDPDYRTLLEAIFRADTVATW